MTVNELNEILGGGESLIQDGDREILSFYAGDFLSNVISKAGDSAAWFTVMNNVNVAGVAVLTEAAVIVICEGVQPDMNLVNRAAAQGISIILTGLPVFEAAAAAASARKEVKEITA